MTRCTWPKNDLAILYHDTEWGVPVHDDRLLFEFLILEGAQAGLSWDTILKKRPNYRKAFDDFDPAKVARYTEKRVARLLENEGIVRNRLKVASTITNARAFLAVQKEFGSFDRYIWQFVGGQPLRNRWTGLDQMPARIRGVGPDEQGSAKPRIPFRRFHHLLRLHASRRNGQRPCDELFPVYRTGRG